MRPYLHAGTNVVLITFPPPAVAAAEAASSDPWRSKTHTAEKAYVRKAAYEYGWDWGPTFVTSGIWLPAWLELWDDARIGDVYIHQFEVSESVAHLQDEVEIDSSAAAEAEIELQYECGQTHGGALQKVMLLPGSNRISIPLDIRSPQRWFPVGYGPHPMYTFTTTIRIGNHIEDQTHTRSGLRSVVLRRDRDAWGRSFEFQVNGIPVFAKGASVIPFDSFPSRVTGERIRRVLQSAVDANMNMIRQWGGGYYESEEFYEMCDEFGLMVWQDFMFGNEWQPGLYAFRENVESEVTYQLKRLRNHPSIVVWCGNNETETSWDWGVAKDANPDVQRRMWQDYLLLFSGTIAQAVSRLAPETPYWPSSPSQNYEDLPPSLRSGDTHDWIIWHGRAPFLDYETRFPRFLTEFGFQSFPEKKAIDAFTLPEDRSSIFSPVMLAHQKSKDGNEIIREYMHRDYGEPKDFESYLYCSQVLQAEGVKIAAEHSRRSRPRTMGTLFWQLNDSWPVASWSSIDYFGRWKALQYYARRFYAPVLVSLHVEAGSLSVYLVSDEQLSSRGKLEVTVMSLDGQAVQQITEDVSIAPLASSIAFTKPLSDIVTSGRDAASLIAIATLRRGDQVLSRNATYLVPVKEIHLPAPKLKTSVDRVDGKLVVRLVADNVVRDVWLGSDHLDLNPQDNFVDVFPGTVVTVPLATTADMEIVRKSLIVKTLNDAFLERVPAAAEK